MSGFQKGDFEASTVIAILAVGGSNRLGRPKQLVQWRGTSLLQHVVDTASQFAPRVLLTLGAEADALWRTLCAPASLERVDVPIIATACRRRCAPRWRARWPDPAAQRLLVMLVDQYAVDDAWLRGLLTLADAHPQRMVASRYAGLRGVQAVSRATPSPRSPHYAATRVRALLRDDANPIDFIAPHAPGDVDTPAQIPRL